MPNEKEKGPGIIKLEKIAAGTGKKAENAQKALENMGFRMDPKVATYMRAAGNPAFLLDTDPDKIRKDFVSGNTVSIDSGGTTLNTNIQGANASNSTTVKKSGGSGKGYSEAYKDADKTKYPTLESFTKAAKSYNKSKSSNSSKPNVSTTEKTNISVDNLLSPKLSKLEAELAKIKHNNVQGEIKAIADSTATSNTLKQLSSLGRLGPDEKAKILRNELPDARQNTYIKSGEGRNARGKNVLGPFQDTNVFIDYVSGRGADAARASVNSDKPAQSQKFSVARDNVYPRSSRVQPENFGGSKDAVSTKDATGFTYEEIKKQSGEKTMKMAHTYFDRNKNKK